MNVKMIWGLKLLSAATLGVAATALTAGHNVGNGGAVVVGHCDPTIDEETPALLLDFWESRYRRQAPAELAGADASVEEHFAIAMNRLRRLDPDRAAKYETWYKEFMDNVLELDTRIELPALVDLGTVLPKLPRGCEVQRIVEQIEPETLLDSRYHIRMDLFDKLSNMNKAGLILHELIYRDAIERGHLTSMRARVFTGVLASKRFEKLNAKEYEELMMTLGMVGYMAQMYGGTLRYFDHLPLKLKEARNFCRNLPGESDIAVVQFAPPQIGGVTWSNIFRSAIGRHMFSNETIEEEVVWLRGNSVKLFQNDLRGIDSSEADKFPFICEQAADASPWSP